MPPKSAKKKPSATLKKSPVKGRATNARVKEDEKLPIRLRQKCEKALNARNGLLKQAAGACGESKEQPAAKVAELESLLNVIPIPIWIASTPDCRHITGNRAAADLTGAPPEANVSQTPGDHPVKVPMMFLRAGRKLAPHELPMQRAGASGQPVSDEFEMRMPDGRVKSLCGHAIPLKDAGGSVTGVIAAFADITERKQAEAGLQQARDMLEQRIRERTAQLAEMNERLEEQLVEGRSVDDALRESEKRFREFWDHAPNLAFVKGTDGRYLYANRKFEDVFHFERGSVPGKTDVELFPRGQADQFQAHDRQVLESAQAEEFEECALHADGLHTSIVVKFPLRDTTGQVCAIGGIATDITARKHIEKELETRAGLSDFVAEVSLSLNLNEPLNLLLQRCVETIVTRLGSALARIWVLEPGDLCRECHHADWCGDRAQCLHLQASAGLSLNLNGEYRRVPLGLLKIGRIAQGAGAMVTNDILQDDRLPNKQWIEDNGLQSFAGFPLVVEGRVFGVLALFGKEPLSEAMLQTVESVCYGVATSIARKRTENRLHDNERALTRSREELRELTGQLLTAQDEERKRIARDLHDDYNQRLAAVTVDLQVLCKSIPASMQGRIAAIAKQVEALSDDIHDLAYHLHPSLLDDVGLEVALRDLVLTFGERENIEVTVSFNRIPGQLPKAVATCLYRVAQESLRNVAKHSKASEAAVALSGSRLGLGLSVRDTGKGFAPDRTTAPAHQGLGLRSMQERLRLVNGVLNVQSRPGHGTKVCAWIPFSEGGS